jgi:hypothetical protein
MTEVRPGETDGACLGKPAVELHSRMMSRGFALMGGA